MSNSSHKGEGVGSPVQTAKHWYYGWGRWWVSEQAFEEYRQDQINKKRARKAGYATQQVDEFLEMESHVHDAVQAKRVRDKRHLYEFRRLKKKHGMHPRANRIHLKAMYDKTKDPDIAKWLQLQDTLTATDAEKIARIRRLFLDGQNPREILYQTARLVGIDLRKKS